MSVSVTATEFVGDVTAPDLVTDDTIGASIDVMPTSDADVTTGNIVATGASEVERVIPVDDKPTKDNHEKKRSTRDGRSSSKGHRDRNSMRDHRRHGRDRDYRGRRNKRSRRRYSDDYSESDSDFVASTEEEEEEEEDTGVVDDYTDSDASNADGTDVVDDCADEDAEAIKEASEILSRKRRATVSNHRRRRRDYSSDYDSTGYSESSRDRHRGSSSRKDKNSVHKGQVRATSKPTGKQPTAVTDVSVPGVSVITLMVNLPGSKGVYAIQTTRDHNMPAQRLNQLNQYAANGIKTREALDTFTASFRELVYDQAGEVKKPRPSLTFNKQLSLKGMFLIDATAVSPEHTAKVFSSYQKAKSGDIKK